MTAAGLQTAKRTAKPTAGDRWRSLSRIWQIVFIAAAAVIALELFTGAINGLYSPPTNGARGLGSSYDASPVGTAAFESLLNDRHYSVTQLTSTLPSSGLRAGTTLFVLNPIGGIARDVAALKTYLGEGGRLVLSGTIAPASLRDLIGSTGAVPLWQPQPSGVAHAVTEASEDYGLSAVAGGTSGSFSLSGSSSGQSASSGVQMRVLLAGSGGDLALIANVGHGTLVLLGSSAPLSNVLLADADNAAFGLDLAGPATRPVLFDEYDHGFGRSGGGLAGLPAHWQAGLTIGFLAAIVWMLSASRRFGPTEKAHRETVPARIGHVDAMALLLASGPPERLVAGSAPLREHARAQLETILRARPGATDQELSELAVRDADVRLSPQLLETLLDTPHSESDLVTFGEAVAQLQERARQV